MGEELAKQSEKVKTSAELRKLEKSKAQQADGDAVDEVSQDESAPSDARGVRLARMAKRALSAYSRHGEQTEPRGFMKRERDIA